MNTLEQLGAINEDVPGEEENLPTLTSPESPRMRALAEIDARNRAKLESELGEQLSDPEPAPDPEPEPAPSPAPEPEVVKHKVKVDGQELEVDTDTLIRTFQKNAAADRRLEEAATLLRQAEQLAAQTAAPPEPAPAPTPAETPEDLKAQAAELLDKLYDGDKDSASEALVKLLAKAQGGSQPTPAPVQAVDPDELASKVLERMANNAALERVKTDYPDILADPDLELVAATKINALVDMGKPRAEAMIEVADSLYKTLGKKPAGRQEDPPAPAKSQRQENKERLDPVPTASATAAVPPSPMESSPSAVIAEMAKRRLGQSLPH